METTFPSKPSQLQSSVSYPYEHYIQYEVVLHNRQGPSNPGMITTIEEYSPFIPSLIPAATPMTWKTVFVQKSDPRITDLQLTWGKTETQIYPQPQF